ncbi:hypothetical protein [Nonomuraea sp. KM88]|uniref:hypothetical protein n=1 Tax=Nonomuraea sp. KM88 TaxID=3457427 RepID=UPI003FCDB1A9
MAMVSMLFGWIGQELRLDRWIVNLSIFEHVPELPGGDMAITPLIVMTVAAAGLTAVRLAGLERRDVPS